MVWGGKERKNINLCAASKIKKKRKTEEPDEKWKAFSQWMLLSYHWENKISRNYDNECSEMKLVCLIFKCWSHRERRRQEPSRIKKNSSINVNFVSVRISINHYEQMTKSSFWCESKEKAKTWGLKFRIQSSTHNTATHYWIKLDNISTEEEYHKRNYGLNFVSLPLSSEFISSSVLSDS